MGVWTSAQANSGPVVRELVASGPQGTSGPHGTSGPVARELVDQWLGN